MMKIALLSFHNAANYGAILQTYALQKALENMGYDCEYINYQNAYRANVYNMFHNICHSLKKGNLRSALMYSLGSPFMYLRKLRFRKWSRLYVKLTSKVYLSSREVSVLNDKYDKFIVGSDQVWNYKNNGNDFAFLLDFVKDDRKKISYSSSFGLSAIPENLLEKYRYCLSSIKYLSVREYYGVDLVKKIVGRSAELVLDPVFLVSRTEWLSFCHPINEKFIFSYTNNDNQFESFLAQTNFECKEYKHYKLARATSISDFLDCRIRVKYTMSPSDFLSVINGASLVVTASFHCISLSIILNKPFIAILTGDKGKDERVLSILSLLGLENRIFTSSMTLQDVERSIDYDIVNMRIDNLRNHSLAFLQNSIMDK